MRMPRLSLVSLFFATLLVACDNNEKAINNEKTIVTPTTTAPVTTVVSENIQWNVSLWSKRRAFTEHVEKLAELVAAKTNGKFTLNLSYGGLSKNKENLDGIAIGAFEMAQFCSFYHKAKNPSITVTCLLYTSPSPRDRG